MSRWPVNEAHFWEKAPFFRLLLALISGILFYTYLPRFSPGIITFTGISTIILFAATVKRKENALLRNLRFLSVVLSVASAGWLLSYYYDIRNDKSWYGNIPASASMIRITDEPAEKEKTWKLNAEVITALTDSATHTSKGKVFIYVYKDKNEFPFHEGDTIIVPAHWQDIKNSGNPFEFDYAAYCKRNNIYQLQFLSADSIALYSNGKPQDISIVRQLHKWCMLQLEHCIKNPETLGLMQAMLIGDEANMDSELRQAYSETGIIHVVAISGSHISFFFLLISLLLGWIRNKKYHWVKYAVALPLVWLYIFMAGAPPSAIRAGIMFSLLAFGLSFEKNTDNTNMLLAAAFVLLCAQPLWLFAVGFQLSFVAVLSLILFYKPVYRLIPVRRKIYRMLWGAIAASISAEILTAPLVIYYFHLFPVTFIIANIAAYLLMGIVMILGMLIIALSSIPAIAAALAFAATFLVSNFDKLVFFLQGLNPSSFRFIDISAPELIMVYVIITGIALFLLRQSKQGLISALATSCLLLISFCFSAWHTLHQRRLVVYNIAGTNHIEMIEGRYNSVLYSDPAIDNKKKNYVLKPAHTGWHAWHYSNKGYSPDILDIGGKSVLIINKPVHSTQNFPVDYLIVNYDARPSEAAGLFRAFTPKKLVIGSAIRLRASHKWEDACRAAAIPLHAVTTHGAFILSNY